MKYITYSRKSSEQEDRQILSLDSQEAVLKTLAKEDKLTVTQTIRESGSAHVRGRKEFLRMIELIESGVADGIIVWDESRLARNAADGGLIIDLLDTGKLVEIRKPGKTYYNTPDDKFFLNLLFGMSKKESDDKGVNVRRGLKTKAEKGWLPAGSKPGYSNEKFAEKGNKTILSDQIRFPIIKKAWQLALTGAWSPPKILNYINNEMGYRSPQKGKLGGKPMCRSQMYLVFRDPFYFGKFQYAGQWYEGKHEKMISEDEFNRVQFLMGLGCSPKPHTHEFFATGLIKCHSCGGAITCEEKFQTICPICRLKFASMNKTKCPKCETQIEDMVNPTRLHYVYYHCGKSKDRNCDQGCLSEDKLIEQIDKYLESIKISERFKNWAIKRLNTAYDNEKISRNAAIDSFQENYKNCVKKIDNLMKLKISPQNSDNQLLSDEEFKDQKDLLITEKNEIEEKMNQTGVRINEWTELSERTFNFARYASYWFRKGDLETKKIILANLGSNLILKDKMFDIIVTKPLQSIMELKKSNSGQLVTIEPEESMVSNAEYDALCDQNKSMLPL